MSEAFAVVVIVFSMVAWLVVGAWVYDDARTRGLDYPLAWAIGVWALGIPALIAYLLIYNPRYRDGRERD